MRKALLLTSFNILLVPSFYKYGIVSPHLPSVSMYALTVSAEPETLDPETFEVWANLWGVLRHDRRGGSIRIEGF